MKVKNWNRYSIKDQERLCNKHEIILVDHQTNKEKILKKLTIKNLFIGIDTFNRGMDVFSKTLDESLKQFSSGLGETKKKDSRNDDDKYDFLLGNKKPNNL